MDESSDEQECIRRSQSGDLEAFELLVRRYQRMIDAVTYRMTGSLTDAEDLAQEAFVQAFRRLDSFRGESAFSTWLYRIAMNICLNWRKREQSRGNAHRLWAQEQETAHEESASDNQVAQRVNEALQKLKPKQRAAIVLTVYEGMNHAEAANVLGCSETTASWRVFAARKKLRRLLEKKDEQK